MTQAYLKAVDKMILDDINSGSTAVILVTPISVAGGIASFLDPVTSLASANIDGNPVPAGVKELLQFTAIQYMTKIRGLGEAAANRVAAAVDATGGWQAFIDRVLVDKKNKKK